MRIYHKVLLVFVYATVPSWGCCPPPPEIPNIHSRAPFDNLKTSIQALGGIAPQVGEIMMQKAASAENAHMQGDSQATAKGLVSLLGMMGELPATEEAALLALDVVTALEKDLDRMMGTRKDKITATKNWNMRCTSALTCEVMRGRYCVELHLNGVLVGCATGRMPNAPPEA